MSIYQRPQRRRCLNSNADWLRVYCSWRPIDFRHLHRIFRWSGKFYKIAKFMNSLRNSNIHLFWNTLKSYIWTFKNFQSLTTLLGNSQSNLWSFDMIFHKLCIHKNIWNITENQIKNLWFLGWIDRVWYLTELRTLLLIVNIVYYSISYWFIEEKCAGMSKNSN